MAARDSVLGASAGHPARPPAWVRVLLGAVMILAGAAVLADVAFASLVSPTFIGAAAILVGAFEIGYAVSTRGWAGFAWQMILGFVYIALGLLLVGVDGSETRLLPYGLGLLLMLSGIVRILFGLRHWREVGWFMLSSGAFGVLAGLVILAEFPKASLWVLGLLLGIDLISHGLAWLGYGFLPATRNA